MSNKASLVLRAVKKVLEPLSTLRSPHRDASRPRGSSPKMLARRGWRAGAAGALVLLAGISMVPGQPAWAGAGNPAYHGLSSQPPTGYLPSPQYYDLAKGQSTLKFSFQVTNPSATTVSLPLDLMLSHILVYNFHDVSTGQPGVPASQVLVNDRAINGALVIQVLASSSRYPLTIGPNTTKIFTAQAALPSCGFYQFDIRSPLGGTGRGLIGGVIRVLGCSATPTVKTTANLTMAPLGTPIQDTALVTGGSSPSGTVSFYLHAPGDNQCFGQDLVASLPGFKNLPFTAGVPVKSPSFTPRQLGTYRWVASYNGDTVNNFAASGCNEELVTVRATPTISTTPVPTQGLIGTTIRDSASVTGGSKPSGSVKFSLYGPADPTCTGRDLVASVAGFQSVPLIGGKAISPSFTPQGPGTYEWVATYGGNTFNMPAGSACGAEAVVLRQVLSTPSISTVATTGGPVGTSIHDTAAVQGGTAPTGTVSFALYGPNDAACSGPNLVAELPGFSNRSLAAGQASSGDFTPRVVGTYNWVATYSGDANNKRVSSECGSEMVTINQAAPVLSTKPSTGGTLGLSIHDQALLAGGYHPMGTVSFSLYGPNDSTCSGPNLVAGLTGFKDVALAESAATSASFTPAAPGTYRWIARYSGDGANLPAGSTCGSETALITSPSPALSLTTTPSAPGTVGLGISDGARLTGGSNPTGTISFSLYGPNDPTCTGTDLVSGALFKGLALTQGSVTSGNFVTSLAGVYRWVATYSGDQANHSVTSSCGAETVTVGKATPTISTTATPTTGTVGVSIHDGAVLAGGMNPTGTVSFALYGPGDATCSGSNLVAGQSGFKDVALSGAGATSHDFTASEVGTYNWVVSYSGDANNAPTHSTCGSEMVTTGAVLGATSSPPLAPTGDSALTLLLLALPVIGAGVALLLMGLSLRRRRA